MQEIVEPTGQPFDVLDDVEEFEGDGLAVGAADVDRHRLIGLRYFRTLLPDMTGVDVPGVVSFLDPALSVEVMSIIKAGLTPVFGRVHGTSRKFFPCSDPSENVRAQLA